MVGSVEDDGCFMILKNPSMLITKKHKTCPEIYDIAVVLRILAENVEIKPFIRLETRHIYRKNEKFINFHSD